MTETNMPLIETAYVAAAQAEAGLLDDAFETAERIETAIFKAQAFTAIAKSLALAIKR